MGSVRSSRGYRLAAVGTAALLVAGGLIVFEATSAVAGGQTRYVATTGDDNTGDAANDCTVLANPCRTIGHGIDEADANDTVQIAAGTYHESVQPGLSITLLGAGTTGASKTTIDGDGASDESIEVQGDSESHPTVTIKDLDVSGNTEADGIVVDDAAADVEDSVVSHNEGSGIEIDENSSLTVNGSTVSNNSEGIVADVEDTDTSTNSVHADASPADSTQATVTLTSDTISDNTTTGVGSGDAALTMSHDVIDGNGDGGVIDVGGPATVTDSTLDSNKGFGFAVEEATGSITDSTVSNTGPADLGDSSGLGAGIVLLGAGDFQIKQSTLYRNTGQGLLSIVSQAHLENSTIVGTRPKAAGVSITTVPDGAVENADSSVLETSVNRVTDSVVRNSNAVKSASVPPTGFVDVSGSVISGNTTPNCTGTISDQKYNLSDDNACTFTATGSKNNGVVRFGSFGDHGGSTDTLVPLKGSAAIDQIPSGSTGCSSDATDQRGHDRLQGAKCDIGSVEADQTPLVVTPSTLPGGTSGVAYRVALTATGGLGGPYTFALSSGALPAGLTLSPAGVISGTPTAVGSFTFTIGVDDPTFKTYTLQIGGAGLAATGTRVESMLEVGAGALVLGIAMMLAAGYRRREGSVE